MYIYQAAVSILPILAAAASISLEARATVPCPSSGLHVMTLGGWGSERPGAEYGDLAGTVQTIKQTVPGSTAQAVSYPNQTKSNNNGLYATTIGRNHLIKRLKKYKKACPKTKVALVGYSAGGVIVMNTLCGQFAPYNVTGPLPLEIGSNIIASILYGEETFVTANPEPPYNLGSCTTGAGAHPRPIANVNACLAYKNGRYTNGIQSYCYDDDFLCCSSGSYTAHDGYPAEYNQAAANYILQRLNDSR